MFWNLKLADRRKMYFRKEKTVEVNYHSTFSKRVLAISLSRVYTRVILGNFMQLQKFFNIKITRISFRFHI